MVPPPFVYDVDRLIELMGRDKKSVGGKITLILLRGIGHAFVSRDVNMRDIRAVWEEFIKS